MAGVDISIERLRELFCYDSESGEIRNIKNGEIAGYFHDRYWIIYAAGKKIKAHRVAWALHFGEWPSAYIDHIDQNKTNNRIDNLRLATSAENNRYQSMRSNNTSGYKGVHWGKSHSKWVATIRVHGKAIALGSYACRQEAAHAYNKAAIKYHGEFAVLNPIGEELA